MGACAKIAGRRLAVEWLTCAYGNSFFIVSQSGLLDECRVTSVPALAIYDKVRPLTVDGIAALAADPTGKDFPWKLTLQAAMRNCLVQCISPRDEPPPLEIKHIEYKKPGTRSRFHDKEVDHSRPQSLPEEPTSESLASTVAAVAVTAPIAIPEEPTSESLPSTVAAAAVTAAIAVAERARDA